MSNKYSSEWPQFFTVSNYKKYPLLKSDSYKEIIIESLKFLISGNRVELNAFVLMSNHIHLIWRPLAGHSLTSIQLSFLRFTAQQIKFRMITDISPYLDRCNVNKCDRQYQIWKRNALSIELRTEKVFYQKLNYIHNNPVKAGICLFPWEYHYSSSLYYENGHDAFNMISHINNFS